MKITSKEIAKQNNLKFYFTGLPCKNNHIDKRYVKSNLCLSCSKVNYQRFKESNPDKLKELQANWYQSNKEQVLERTTQWNSDNKEKRKERDSSRYYSKVANGFRQRKYGLTQEQIEDLLTQADHKCQICKKSETSKDRNGNVKKLAIDHCHTSNKVRGILCNKCNTAIGLLSDSVELLFSAIKYLKDNN